MVHSINLLIAVAAFGAASTVAAPLSARDYELPTPQTREFEPELETRELEARRRRGGSGRSGRSRTPSLNTVNNVLDVANTALPIVNTLFGRELSGELEARDYGDLEARRRRGGGRSSRSRSRVPSLNTVNNVLDVANTALPVVGSLLGQRRELSEDLEARDYEALEARRRRGGSGRGSSGRVSRRPSLNTVNNIIDTANTAVPLVGALFGQPQAEPRDFVEELDAREFDDLEARDFEELEARRKVKASSTPAARPAAVAVPPVKAVTPAARPASPPPRVATPPPKVVVPPPKAATPPPKAATPPPRQATPPPKAVTPPKRVLASPKRPSPQPGRQNGQHKRPANGQHRPHRQQQQPQRHSTTNQKVNTALHGVDTLINGIQTWQSLTKPAAPPAVDPAAVTAPVDPAVPVEGTPPVVRSFEDWEELEARDSAYDELD